MTKQAPYIELDCQPGSLRPGDLFPSVLEGTGLKPNDFTNVLKFFGNWTWVLNKSRKKAALYRKARLKVIRPRIKVLYNDGYIRWGSW